MIPKVFLENVSINIETDFALGITLNRENELKNSKGVAKASFGSKDEKESSESDSDSGHISLNVVARASTMKLTYLLLYEISTSHNFMRNKNNFFSMKKFSKPFEFGQAVRNSELSY